MNKTTWAVCILALLWLILWTSGALAADITLRWDAAAGADSYRIYQSVDVGATWTDTGIETADTQATVMVPDSGLVLLRVSAVNTVGEAPRLHSGAWYNGHWMPPDDPGGAGVY